MQFSIANASADRAEFGRLFDWLRVLGIKETQPVDPDAYWRLLHELPFAAVREAITTAPTAFPIFFPSAPSLAEMARGIAKRMSQYNPLPNARPSAPEDEPRLPPNHRAMRLAREWEEESRRLGLGDTGVAPREVAKRRMAELADLLSDVGA